MHNFLNGKTGKIRVSVSTIKHSTNGLENELERGVLGYALEKGKIILLRQMPRRFHDGSKVFRHHDMSRAQTGISQAHDVSSIQHGCGNGHPPQPESATHGESTAPLQNSCQPVLLYSRKTQAMSHGGLLVGVVSERNAKVDVCVLNGDITPTKEIIAQDVLGLNALWG